MTFAIVCVVAFISISYQWSFLRYHIMSYYVDHDKICRIWLRIWIKKHTPYCSRNDQPLDVYLASLWRHNGRDGVTNHQPYDCLLNHPFRCRSKKTLKLRVTGLCAGNSPVQTHTLVSEIRKHVIGIFGMTHILNILALNKMSVFYTDFLVLKLHVLIQISIKYLPKNLRWQEVNIVQAWW